MSEVNLQQKQLRRSAFLVYDQAHQEESLPEDEVFLFYWPPDISLDHRHFLHGGTAAALSIISDLSPNSIHVSSSSSSSSSCSSNTNTNTIEEIESPVIFLKLQNNKCAVKQEGEFVFVLTSEINESDSSLKSSLEMIYQSFLFYNKNTQSILERNHNNPRRELIKDFTKAMEELLPLIIDSSSRFSSPFISQREQLNSSSSGSSTFLASNCPKLSIKTIPYLELPPKTNRYFIKASQILSALSSFPSNAPTVNTSLYQSTNSLSSSGNSFLLPTTVVPKASAPLEITPSSSPVSSHSLPLHSHKSEINEGSYFSAVSTPSADSNFVDLISQLRLRDEAPESSKQDTEYQTLPNAFSKNTIFGSMICQDNMVIDSHLDHSTTRNILNKIAHIKNTFERMRTNFDVKSDPHIEKSCVWMPSSSLKQLLGEEKYRSYLLSFDCPPTHQIPCGLFIVFYTTISIAFITSSVSIHDPQFLTSFFHLLDECKIFHFEGSLNKMLKENIPSHRLVSHRTISSSPIGSLSNNLNPTSTVNIPQKGNLCTTIRVPYYSEESSSTYHYLYYDQLNEVANGNHQSINDLKFVANVNYARNVLQENNKASQILLQDDKSGFYCRRTFGKELYFQPNSTNPHDMFMRYIDRTVRDNLSRDHHINTI